MKIRTYETVQKYETWEYEIDVELPEGFMDWNGEDQYTWLLGCNAELLYSDYANLGTIDEIKIID